MTDILTLEQVAECRERAERATDAISGAIIGVIQAFGRSWRLGWRPGLTTDEQRALDVLAETHREYSSALARIPRIDIPALCATVEALRVENERLRGLLRDWTDMDPLRYDSEYSCCPWCNFDYQNMKHELDCPFVLARDECGISSAPGS